MNERRDAVVIGGGPAGATAALLLARAGWAVSVVERKAFPRRKVCGEYLSATNLPLLEHLGVAAVFHESAGPDVRRVAVFAGEHAPESPLPRPAGFGWGRALSRERLDSLLLAAAVNAGAEVLQPWSAVSLARADNGYHVTAVAADSGARREFVADVVVLAHGSWDRTPLPSQSESAAARPSDLLGFKAHFRDSALPEGLMPLLAFPGGYGGMVHTDAGRVSLSCCVRRDQLAARRRGQGGAAGDAVLGHIRESCRGVRRALEGAVREGEWLAAGPIRPGVRELVRGGVFAVGNAAGEAHPVVAEGISMAMQSAWLLTERLLAGRLGAGPSYGTAWRRAFLPRLRASRLLAHGAMSPAAVGLVLPLLRRFPALLTWGARRTGKVTRVLAPIRETAS